MATIEVDEKYNKLLEEIETLKQQQKLILSVLESRMERIESILNLSLNNLIQEKGDKYDVPVEPDEYDSNLGEQDVLTPQDIFTFPDPLKKTAFELIKLRIASAEEISDRTRRERAVESGYLNQLEKSHYCHKIRLGRTIFFAIGPIIELDPLRLNDLSKLWNLIFIICLRLHTPSEDVSEIEYKKFLDQFDKLSNKEINKHEQSLDTILLDIDKSLDVLKYNKKQGKIIFYRIKWLEML